MQYRVGRKQTLLILYILIPLISLLMHWQVFTLDIVGFHSWRQTQTQTNVVNFYEEDFNILNPRINFLVNEDGVYRMEFPLMQWVFAGFYKIFGNHIFISRFLSFIIGIFSVIGIYQLFRKLFKERFLALSAAWVLSFSPLFYYYTLNPMPDNFALMTAIWGLYFFTRWQEDKRLLFAFLSGVFHSLSIATKLPFIFYTLVPLSVYIMLLFRKQDVRQSILAAGIQFICFLPAFAWYAWVIPEWSNGITAGVANTENYNFTIVLGYIRHHLISTLPEVIVNYGAVLFFLAGIFFAFRKKLFATQNAKAYTVLFIGLIFYFLFEINMIEKVHDYYLMPFLIPVVILVILGIRHVQWPKVVVFGLLLILPLAAYLRMDSRWNTEKPGFNKDLLIYKEELRKAVLDTARVIYVHDPSPSISLYYLHKKGWTYTSENFSAEELQILIEKGNARYLFSDQRELESQPEIRKFLEKEIGRFGEVRVFLLGIRN